MLPALAAVLIAATQADTGKRITATGDAGLVNIAGNSEATSISLGDKVVVRAGAWSIGQSLAILRASTHDSVSAANLQASVRIDRSLSTHASLFVRTDLERDRFAGIASRITPAAGVAAVLVADSSNLLRVEIGAGYTWQQAIAPNPDRRFVSGRIAALYHLRIGQRSAFEQAIEAIPDLQNGRDLRINSESSITAPITGGIALKASYRIRYAGLPEPGFRKVDRILTTGVQVTL